MAINAIDNKTYTYTDYLKFTDDEPVEIIDGRISAMSPAPSRIHQEIITEILFKIRQHIELSNGPCKVYPAPCDVIFKNDDEDVINSKNIHI